MFVPFRGKIADSSRLDLVSLVLEVAAAKGTRNGIYSSDGGRHPNVEIPCLQQPAPAVVVLVELVTVVVARVSQIQPVSLETFSLLIGCQEGSRSEGTVVVWLV